MIRFSNQFLKDIKKLRKKFPLIKKDIDSLIENLKTNPTIGTSLGENLYKIRIPNSSIPTGKSGGFRIITYVIINKVILLTHIYSKTEKETISIEEILDILKREFK
jgi:mRNA-degrading endonuclease RelE of RelBE toxin-antitoxin system